VAYDDLRRHVKYCPDVHDDHGEALGAVESVDARLSDVERRLIRRISRLEAELEVRKMVSRTDDTSTSDR
jgi:hypothetical protein